LPIAVDGRLIRTIPRASPGFKIEFEIYDSAVGGGATEESGLPRTNHGKISAVRAGEFVQDFQASVFGQHPAEGIDRVRVVEAQADSLAALQRDLAVDHGQPQVARRLKLPRDHAQALMPLVVPL